MILRLLHIHIPPEGGTGLANAELVKNAIEGAILVATGPAANFRAVTITINVERETHTTPCSCGPAAPLPARFANLWFCVRCGGRLALQLMKPGVEDETDGAA